jgi:hypothetical protein
VERAIVERVPEVLAAQTHVEPLTEAAEGPPPNSHANLLPEPENRLTPPERHRPM